MSYDSPEPAASPAPAAGSFTEAVRRGAPARLPKVAYVVKRYPRYSETFIVNELLAHQRAGQEQVIFALRPSSDTHFQDCISQVRAPVYYVPGPSTRSQSFWEQLRSQLPPRRAAEIWEQLLHEDAATVGQAAWLASELARHQVDHLHAHFATSATSVARLAALLAGKSYSFTAHAKDIFHESVCEADLRRKVASAARVVTVSDFNVADLRRRFGGLADKVERIYNGLDLNRFPFCGPADPRPAGGGAHVGRIVAVGRLVEKKGFRDLIAACGALRDSGVSFHCQIIGGGELEDALRQQVAALRLQERVALTGPLPQAEVVRRVSAADLLAAPCVVGDDGNRDGLPTVLLEAMALGTPCVSTDVTGIPEVLRHGETGWLVPQNQPGELAAALRALLADPPLRAQLAAAARRLIEAEFDFDATSKQLRRVFHDSVAAAPRSAKVESGESGGSGGSRTARRQPAAPPLTAAGVSGGASH